MEEKEYWIKICEMENVSPSLVQDLCNFKNDPTYTPINAIPSAWIQFKELFEKIIKLEKAEYYKNLIQAKESIEKAKSIAEECGFSWVDRIASLTKVQDF